MVKGNRHLLRTSSCIAVEMHTARNRKSSTAIRQKPLLGCSLFAVTRLARSRASVAAKGPSSKKSSSLMACRRGSEPVMRKERAAPHFSSSEQHGFCRCHVRLFQPLDDVGQRHLPDDSILLHQSNQLDVAAVGRVGRVRHLCLLAALAELRLRP